jgi:integrase
MAARIKTNQVGVYYYVQPRVGGPGTEKVFYIVFKKDGKVHEEKAGRQYADAMTAAKASRIRAARIEGTRESGKERRARKKAEKDAQANRWTLNRLWEAYAAQKAPSHSLTTDAGRYQKHLAPALGEKEPGELLTLDADRLRVKILKTHSPQTAKHVLALLKRIIRFGVRAGLVDPPSPRKFSIKMPSFDNTRTETLTDEQLAALLRAAAEDSNTQAGALVRLALATGLRRGEMLRLRWQDIDVDAGFITLPRTKSGKVQRVPLNALALDVLEGLPRTSEYCFPGQKDGEHAKGLYPALRRIRKRAGLPDSVRPLHAWRHVYASRLASSGESLYVVQKLLRHSDGRMTQRYSHLADETLRQAANKAGRLMEQAEAQAGQKQGQKVVNMADHRKG